MASDEQISASLARSFAIPVPVVVDRQIERHLANPNKHYVRAQLDSVKNTKWIRKEKNRVWSTAQVLKTDHNMDACVRINTDGIAAYAKENVKTQAMVDIMVKRLGGETSTANIDAAIEILQTRLAIGEEVHARLHTDIYDASSKSLKAWAALNKLGPPLAKSTKSLTLKIRELQDERYQTLCLFMGNCKVTKRSRM